MFSSEYKEIQVQYHKDRPEYGTSSPKFRDAILQVCQQFKVKKVLDYGCGKGMSKVFLANNVREIVLYDPFVEMYSDKPLDSFDLVLCTDVMEHVEEKFVLDVLQDIFYYSNCLVFFNISLVPAIKTLPDGRNTHITLKPVNYWMLKLLKYFDIINAGKQFSSRGVESLTFLGTKYGIELQVNAQ